MLRKKSLGQHFLHSAHYVQVVADAAGLTKGEVVLEVGPGEGVLTKELLACGATVVAVEKDTRLIPVLHETFTKEIKSKKLVVHEADALEFDTAKLLPKTKKYKVVANIPYYITGALLKKFLSGAHQPSTLVFLIQKEVAERITGHGANNKTVKESILSLSVKAYGTPVYVQTVPKGAFVPAPTVDSAVLLVKNISRSNFNNTVHEERFFELVRTGFGQKRKLLASNLKKILGPSSSNILQNVGVSPKARAEDLTLEQWLTLAR